MSPLNSMEEYGINFQNKVISSLLKDKEFVTNVIDVLKPDYFPSQAHKWIVDEIIRYFNKYKTIPTQDVLKVELGRTENEILQISIKEQLKNTSLLTNDDVDYIKEEFTNFCKNQNLKQALLESVDLLREGEFDHIRDLIDKALKAGNDKNIGLEYIDNIVDRYKEDYRNPIPTPWDEVNHILQGGLGEGDLGIVYGNPGGGKSWVMIALAAHAVKLGYNVNFYTLELGDSYVGRRFDAYFTGIGVNDVQEYQNEIQSALSNLKGNLIIKEFPMKGASLSTIRSHISKCEQLGKKPDLVIIDYLDLLTSDNKNLQDKAELDDIYRKAKGLAKELKLPIWSPSQVNRAGSRDNVIEGDKSAGSYDKLMIADFSASFSRKKEDKINGTARLHIMKSRYGGDGMTYFMKADTSTGHIDVIEEYDEDNEQHNPQYSKQEEKDWKQHGIDKQQKDNLKNLFNELKDKLM